MSQPSRISELASMIQVHTSKIDNYMLSRHLPSPSFDVNTVAPNLSNELQNSRDAILGATDELNALVQGPVPFLINLVTNNHNSLISLHAIYRYQISTSFPSNSESSFREISERCGLNEDDTRRLLRHAMTYRIFCEPRKGIVAHTLTSRILAEMPLFLQWIGQSCEDMWPAAVKMVDAMRKWPGSEEPNQAGFNLANGTDDPVYTEISKTEGRVERLVDAMDFFHSWPGFEISHLLEYDWTGAEGRGEREITTVVDVGGSHGIVSIELAKRFPRIECIVQDLPEVIANAKAPPLFADRVKFMAHDFFAEQPIKGADVYHLRWILHNWSDKYAVRILQALVPALKRGARVILSEFVMPEHGTVSLYKERYARTMDMAMKELQNAKERTADDWAQLFYDANQRFTLQQIIQPTGSDLAIIVALWE